MVQKSFGAVCGRFQPVRHHGIAEICLNRRWASRDPLREAHPSHVTPKEKTMRVSSLFSAGLALALIANSTLAGDVRLYRAGETPDPREVGPILEAFKTRPIKTRSGRLLDAPARPRPLALPVRFAFDSAQVLPESIPALEAVASGIKLAGPAARILIEGHTDAAGSDAYNVTPSQKRAPPIKTRS